MNLIMDLAASVSSLFPIIYGATVLHRGYYVRSLVNSSRPDDAHGQAAPGPARAVLVPSLRTSARAYPDLLRLGPALLDRVGMTVVEIKKP
jgi:hypothetical protein